MGNFLVFTSYSPAEIKFGWGVSEQVGKECKDRNAGKVLVITDKGVKNAGLLDGITKALENENINFEIYDEVEPNPTIAIVEKGKEVFKKVNPDLLLAVGGGSAIDAAKAIGIVVNNEGSIKDYQYGKEKIKNAIPPMITIPTTAGTGSEVNIWSVITDPERKFKMSIGGSLTAMTPKLCLADPKLTVTMPLNLTAASGMDALTHAVEAYVCVKTQPISDILCLYAIETISENLRQAVANGENIEARTKLLLASILAGIAFTNAGLGAVHAFADVLGGYYNAPHGVLNAIFLPYICEFNLVARPKRFAEIARKMGEKVDNLSLRNAAMKAVDVIKELSRDIGIPSLKELGAREEDIAELSKLVSTEINIFNNPRKAKVEDLAQILEKVFKE